LPYNIVKYFDNNNVDRTILILLIWEIISIFHIPDSCKEMMCSGFMTPHKDS